MPDQKQLLFVQTRAPHGSINGQEGLDAILAGSAFAECSVLLMEDAVFQVLDNQATESLRMKNYAVSYGALKDYGVSSISVPSSHLAARNITAADLCIDVEILTDDDVRRLMHTADVILTF